MRLLSGTFLRMGMTAVSLTVHADISSSSSEARLKSGESISLVYDHTQDVLCAVTAGTGTAEVRVGSRDEVMFMMSKHQRSARMNAESLCRGVETERSSSVVYRSVENSQNSDARDLVVRAARECFEAGVDRWFPMSMCRTLSKVNGSAYVRHNTRRWPPILIEVRNFPHSLRAVPLSRSYLDFRRPWKPSSNCRRIGRVSSWR